MNYGITKNLTKANIYEKIDSYNIFRKYCEGFSECGKKFVSPLRDNDNNPSASIIFYEGDLLFKDFGGQSLRAVDFVKELYGISFVEALQKINADFDLQLNSDIPYIPSDKKVIIYKTPAFTEKTNTIIKIKKRQWEQRDIDFWNQYHIQLKTLLNFTVHTISHFTIDGNLYFSDLLSYSYDYYVEDGVFRRKIYQPYSFNKWFSNGGLVVQGEGMLPKKGDLLIITSSLKDVMVLYEIGYTAIAPTSEMTMLPPGYFEKQKQRFNKIIVFMNNDEVGIKRNIKISKELNIPYIYIPTNFKEKDPSDFAKSYGLKELKSLIHEKIL